MKKSDEDREKVGARLSEQVSKGGRERRKKVERRLKGMNSKGGRSNRNYLCNAV